MLDLGWQELMMVAFVLVLVVGPKDLPRVLRAFAKFVGKARGMASEFQSSMMEVANQDEFRDVKKALQDAKSGNFDDIASGLDGVKETVEDISKEANIAESVESIKASAQDIKSEADRVADEEADAGQVEDMPVIAKPVAKKASSKKAASKKPAAKKSAAKKSASKKTAAKKTAAKKSSKAKT